MSGSLRRAPHGASPLHVTLAWAVHALTASGAVVGAAALLAIAAGAFSHAGLLMLLAFAIDAVDGSLARAARVGEVLPQVDGRRLDDMVDYLNYVIVPAVFLVAQGQLLGWGWAAVPILASAYGFSQDEAKTEDDFFLGFPSYWNAIALYLWLLEIPAAAGTAIVVAFAALVFVPVKYIYPSRTRALGRTTGVGATLWWFALTAAVLAPVTTAPLRLVELSLAFPIYYFAASLWVGGLRRRGTR